MFLAAARALAEFTIKHATGEARLYPSLHDLHQVSRKIAFKVAQTAREEGLGRSLDDESLQAAIERFWWVPEYA